MRQSLLIRREQQQEQPTECHHLCPSRSADAGARRLTWGVSRRQVRLQDRARRSHEGRAWAADQITGLPVGRKLGFEDVQALKVVDAAHTRIQQASDQSDQLGFGSLARPGQGRQAEAEDVRPLGPKLLGSRHDQEVHDAVG